MENFEGGKEIYENNVVGQELHYNACLEKNLEAILHITRLF
jgi:hypothetical protein